MRDDEAIKKCIAVICDDDDLLQTIVEKRLIEDEERTVREVTQYYKKDQPKWDVVIRSHQAPPDDDTWERGKPLKDLLNFVFRGFPLV